MVQHAPRCDAVPFFAPRRRQCRRVQHAPRCGKTAILADSRFFEISFFDSFQFYRTPRYNTQHAGTVSVEIYRPRRCRTRYNTLRAAVKATSFNQDMSFRMELRLSHGERTTCSQLRTCHQKVFQLRLPHNVRYNTLKTVETTMDSCASTAPATENGTTRSAL